MGLEKMESKMKERIEDIEIDKIGILDNTRLRIHKSELDSLMEDIKHRGLLQPIGVLDNEGKFILRFGNRRLEACKRLGWKTIPSHVVEKKLSVDQFMSDNFAENVERADISPIEVARTCKWYKDRGYSLGEIAVILSEPKSKIEKAISLAEKVPEEFKDTVKWIKSGMGKDKKGAVSVSVANQILQRWTTKANVKALFEAAKKEELSVTDIKTITVMVNRGCDLKEAIANRDDYATKSVIVVINKAELAKYKDVTFAKLVPQFIRGDIEPNKKLVTVE